MPFQVGQRVGDYEVIQLLGAGGMGSVYRVRNIISNRLEAMKVLLPDLTAQPDLAMRFISEIRTLAGFDHPNIAKLNTALQADNQLIMMMEYVEGYTLEQMATQRQMSLNDVVNYLSQALSALAYAHERDVIHRDIKPANLMVTSHGIVKLMDFGIAKSSGENNAHTKPGTTMGSLYYMSPEQVRGSGVDPRSDIYSVGIVLYELLAGRRPFEADTTFSILNQQLNTPPQPPIEVNPALPPQLNEIILRALAKDPAQRFQTAEEFRKALKPFAKAAVIESAGDATQVLGVTTPYSSAPQPVAAAPQAAPAYANVPAPAYAPANAPAYGAAADYANPGQGNPGYQQPYGAPAPPPRQGGSKKALWIATGAIAAVLALVGVGFAVPRILKTHAASSGTAADAGHADASVSTTPTAVAPEAEHTTAVLPAPTISSTGANANSVPSVPPVMGGRPAMGGKGSGRVDTSSTGGGMPTTPAPSGNAGGGQPGPTGSSNAELEQAEEHLMQITARATTAKRGVGQIRSQQEASGLGLRGDVESAESRMDAYIHAANNEMGRGNAAGATRNIDKAEAELTTLEKFLGH